MSSLWVSLSHHFALTAAVVFRPPPPCVVQRTGAQFRSAMFTERLPHVAPGVTETWSLSQETLCHPSLKCPGRVFVLPWACASSVTTFLSGEATAWVALPHPGS